ncbi:hypothetical protein [Bdellovibrio sp.]|uniref:hypothetical protein n=1 Tax=Bdellovibrio sp. TaxID=28201 RepID=UPI0039E2BC48
MMSKLIRYVVLSFFVAGLSACVEVKDSEEGGETTTPLDAPRSMVEDLQTQKNLVVDRPLFIYKGRILDAEEFAEEKTKPGFSEVATESEFHFESIDMMPEGALYTMGGNVRIHVQKLTSEKSLISTFPQGSQAQPQEDGRDGGHLFLNVNQAEGSLQIEMRGEAGGVGKEGKAPDLSLKGPRGKVLMGAQYCDNPAIVKGEEVKGQRGLKGYPGGAGSSGGNSGTLEVRFQNSENLSIQVHRYPGQGGAGGKGGRGGKGGDPGRYPCQMGRLPQGPEGEPGDPGADGKNGVAQTVCRGEKQSITCY